MSGIPRRSESCTFSRNFSRLSFHLSTFVAADGFGYIQYARLLPFSLQSSSRSSSVQASPLNADALIPNGRKTHPGSVAANVPLISCNPERHLRHLEHRRGAPGSTVAPAFGWLCLHFLLSPLLP